MAFARRAAQLGVEIFYITNRDKNVEKATRRNLLRWGFPVNAKLDTVMMKGEQPDWTSDKTSRRKVVTNTHRVLLLIGDDLNDFNGKVKKDPLTRQAMFDAYRHRFGHSWHCLPNPTYGSWQRILLRGQDNANAAKRTSLDPARTLAPK